MTEKNTAKMFLHSFIDRTSNEVQYNGMSYPFMDLYKYKYNASTFTDFMNKHLIAGIVREYCGDNVTHEYFRIDTVGWKSKAEDELMQRASKFGLSYHLWDLQIAVEHENSEKGWLDEVVKLMHIRCPLKVVIGYTEHDQRDIDNEKLILAAAFMQKLTVYDSTSQEEFLVILGNKKGKGSDYSTPDYRGYLFNFSSGRFVQLQSNVPNSLQRAARFG